MYLDRNRRKELFFLMNKCAPDIQKLVRGFLAKKGTQKIKFLRKAFRSWFKPQFAVDFLQKLFSKNFYSVNENTNILEVQANVSVKKDFVRQFLQDDKLTRAEVDFRSFDNALELYYKSIGIPMSISERNSINRRFKNFATGTISISQLDSYIFLHKFPCRKHGRQICCDCVFRRECQLRNCQCNLYICEESKKKSYGENSICLSCNHPGKY
jgi:hypothetical protein